MTGAKQGRNGAVMPAGPQRLLERMPGVGTRLGRVALHIKFLQEHLGAVLKVNAKSTKMERSVGLAMVQLKGGANFKFESAIDAPKAALNLLSGIDLRRNGFRLTTPTDELATSKFLLKKKTPNGLRVVENFLILENKLPSSTISPVHAPASTFAINAAGEDLMALCHLQLGHPIIASLYPQHSNMLQVPTGETGPSIGAVVHYCPSGEGARTHIDMWGPNSPPAGVY
ncbi:hypothetical protein BDK51DRAFT_42707 [Blyttiomyces helicus]|uniref:Uncharacterized protein n=1 Tax=Blyttiomyces helicus TaxID=388810 RepID=A0A4P9VUH7_9FUNG|nr:hypothetical protein BDK51DRAFT_42707 [Blyttiomyces helicus]|eukprot:RKO83249.1 hypothetical protein BDK51DRAFT_42707 [Blyttiomyces helicus]